MNKDRLKLLAKAYHIVVALDKIPDLSEYPEDDIDSFLGMCNFADRETLTALQDEFTGFDEGALVWEIIKEIEKDV